MVPIMEKQIVRYVFGERKKELQHQLFQMDHNGEIKSDNINPGGLSLVSNGIYDWK